MEEAIQLKEFLEAMEKYSPTIPEEVVSYYLQQTGVDTKDPRFLRLISLVTQRFLSDITHDAMQYNRIRTQSSSSSSNSTGAGATTSSSTGSSSTGTTSSKKDSTNPHQTKKHTLMLQDLVASLREYGINIVKPEYYSDFKSSKDMEEEQAKEEKQAATKASP